jgi:hypothetical protein
MHVFLSFDSSEGCQAAVFFIQAANNCGRAHYAQNAFPAALERRRPGEKEKRFRKDRKSVRLAKYETGGDASPGQY